MRAETIHGGLYCRSTHNGCPPDKTRAVVPRSDQTASPGASELTRGIGTARADPATVRAQWPALPNTARSESHSADERTRQRLCTLHTLLTVNTGWKECIGSSGVVSV